MVLAMRALQSLLMARKTGLCEYFSFGVDIRWLKIGVGTMVCGTRLMAGMRARFVRRSSSGTMMGARSFRGRDMGRTRSLVDSRGAGLGKWLGGWALKC